MFGYFVLERLFFFFELPAIVMDRYVIFFYILLGDDGREDAIKLTYAGCFNCQCLDCSMFIVHTYFDLRARLIYMQWMLLVDLWPSAFSVTPMIAIVGYHIAGNDYLLMTYCKLSGLLSSIVRSMKLDRCYVNARNYRRYEVVFFYTSSENSPSVILRWFLLRKGRRKVKLIPFGLQRKFNDKSV